MGYVPVIVVIQGACPSSAETTPTTFSTIPAAGEVGVGDPVDVDMSLGPQNNLHDNAFGGTGIGE